MVSTAMVQLTALSPIGGYKYKVIATSRSLRPQRLELGDHDKVRWPD